MNHPLTAIGLIMLIGGWGFWFLGAVLFGGYLFVAGAVFVAAGLIVSRLDDVLHELKRARSAGPMNAPSDLVAAEIIPPVDSEAVAQGLFDRARQQLSQGQRSEAVETLQAIVKLHPGTAAAERAKLSLAKAGH